MESHGEFHLLGQKIGVKTQAEADLAKLALEIANKKVSELQARAPMLGPQQLAVLALVEVAGDLVKDRKIMDEYRNELDLRCSYLLTQLGNSEKTKSKKHKAV